MYIVSILSKNEDFLESLPQAILNYNVGNLKFYFLNSVDQLNQQLKQSGYPDLLLCDRDFELGKGWDDNTLHKAYLSDKRDSADEIYIYKNTELFLMEVQRRVSSWREKAGADKNQMGEGRDRKLIWFLDPTESEWGKSCYNEWVACKYRTGQRSLCLDFSTMGILDRGKRLPSPYNLSKLLENWMYKRGQLIEADDLGNSQSAGFLVVDGVCHPMDLEMLKPDFIETLYGSLGASYEEICLYSSLKNEALTKCLLRYTEEIILLSDQPDVYEGPILQLEAWLKEIHPRGQVTIMHSRSDPNRKLHLKNRLLDRASEKGRRP